jgi:hypothetical protein
MKLPKPTTVILILTAISAAVESVRAILEAKRRKP